MASSKIRTGDVRVEGLRELDRALKELGPDTRAALKETSKDVAEREASRVRSAASGMGGVSAKAAPSISARASFQSAGLAFGGSAYPFAAGAAFGGQGRPTTQQFPPWRQGGYWPFPQIGADSGDITDAYVDAVNRIIAHNFPD